MKERPILFSAPMVKAILEGRKTQTRRPMRDVPAWVTSFGHSAFSIRGPEWRIAGRGAHPEFGPAEKFFKCPFGQAGDRLWVRETWADLRGGGFDFPVAYCADTRPGSPGDRCRIDYGIKWKPSIHMPRWASRITLEITRVRVERLQEISEEDAKAEGFPIDHIGKFYEPAKEDTWQGYARASFNLTWSEIYGPGSLEVNPWVWVIEFRKVQ